MLKAGAAALLLLGGLSSGCIVLGVPGPDEPCVCSASGAPPAAASASGGGCGLFVVEVQGEIGGCVCVP